MWSRLPEIVLLLCLWPTLAWGTAREIRQDQRWSGQVELCEPLLVAQGVVLEIEAGTQIRVLDASARLLVRGRLLVLGSEASPVRFSAPDQWLGIEFIEAEPGSRIEHARFEGCSQAVSVIAASPVLMHNRFEHCGVGIRLLREAHSLVEANYFSQNRIGLEVSMRSAPRVVNNRFFKQQKSGIETSNDSRGLIEGNLFEDNAYGVALQQKFVGEIRGNQFRNNQTGLFSYQTQNASLIENNLFQGNQSGLTAISFSYPTVRNNRFIDNRMAISNDQFGSALIEYNLFQGNGTAIFNNRKSSPGIRNNQFIGNERALVCDYSSYPEVKRNNFGDNRIAAELGMYQSADWEHRAGSKELVRQEALSRGSRNPLLEQAPTRFSDALDLSGNWWSGETARLREAGADANLEMFFDRRDKSEVKYPGYGDQSYQLDRIVYAPWLEAPVSDAGPKVAP